MERGSRWKWKGDCGTPFALGQALGAAFLTKAMHLNSMVWLYRSRWSAWRSVQHHMEWPKRAPAKGGPNRPASQFICTAAGVRCTVLAI